MSGPREDCAVGGVYWVREDGASQKKWQELLVLLAVVMKVLCEGNMG